MTEPDFTPLLTNRARYRSVVYFVYAASANLIKIGVSSDLIHRYNALCTGSPVSLMLLGYVPGDQAYEQELHQRFAKHRKHGEWFQANNQLSRAIAGIIGLHGIRRPDE